MLESLIKEAFSMNRSLFYSQNIASEESDRTDRVALQWNGPRVSVRVLEFRCMLIEVRK